jgi:hypothetical protein
MTKDQAHTIAASWRQAGYDVRIVQANGEYAALALREDGNRWYVYQPPTASLAASVAPSPYAGSGSAALHATVDAPR